MDGRDAILAIREWSQMPILVLSVRDAETNKIAALDAGADDYVHQALRHRRAPPARLSCACCTSAPKC